MSENSPHLNKKAFVTGSSRGIGRAIAVELAKTGYDVLLHYHKNEKAAQDSVEQIKSLGRRTWLYQANLCDSPQTQNMLDQIVEEHKTLDVYVANAASTAFKPLVDVNQGNIEKTFALVVTGFINTVQKLRPLLKNRDSQILTLSGIDTLQYCPGHGLLAAAKSALETLTRYFSVELSADKIHVKCLNPGLVATDSTKFYLGSDFDDI
jgi:enoyl-[acyl-carrier protein] reductase III